MSACEEILYTNFAAKPSKFEKFFSATAACGRQRANDSQHRRPHPIAERCKSVTIAPLSTPIVTDLQRSRHAGEQPSRHRQQKSGPARARPLLVYGGDAQIRTGGRGFAGPCLTTWPRRHMKRAGRLWPAPHSHGADNGARTRDPHLGKVVLYQLSHVRVRGDTIHKLCHVRNKKLREFWTCRPSRPKSPARRPFAETSA